MKRCLVGACTLLVSAASLAHHSVSSLYDYTNVQRLEGTLTSIRWVNPHVQLKIETINADGELEVWQLEASALNLLRRLGVDKEAIKVGDKVAATGPVSRRGQKTMIASTLTLPDGRTIALFPGSAKRAGLIDAIPVADGSTQRDAAEIEADRQAAHGIFRVWTPRKKPTLDQGLGIPQWPLTVAALESVQAYNPLFDDPALRCVPAGMPIIMDNPYPMEFYEEGDDIIMHLELSDGLRRIHMNPESGEGDIEPSSLGYSVGRWEDNVLVIHTDRINYPYFDDLGTPQSGNLKIVERYTLSEDQTRLDWEAIAEDPEIFTEPVSLTGYLVWVPGEEVQPFDCTIPEGFSWQLKGGR